MARLDSWDLDERGAVYVEFLASFFPLFLIFLSVCQLSLLTTARVVVGQAANQAARSAAVVLEDSPDHYDDAPRRTLSEGEPNPDEAIEALISGLGFGELDGPSDIPDGPQHGARMVPIRTAAYSPLLALAPDADAWAKESSISGAVRGGFLENLEFAVAYSRAATSISLHDAPRTIQLPVEPLREKSVVSARVTYFFRCSIPFVRKILCDSLPNLLTVKEGEPEPLSQAEAPDSLIEIAPEEARFMALTAVASLPTQNAGYTNEGNEE